MTKEELMKLSVEEQAAELMNLSEEELDKLLDEHPDIMDVISEELYKKQTRPGSVRLTYRESLGKEPK